VLHHSALRYLCWNVWLYWVSTCFHENKYLLQCLILVNMFCSNFGHRQLLLPFNYHWITCIIVVIGSIRLLDIATLSACSLKSIVSCWVSLPFLLSAFLDLKCINLVQHVKSVMLNGFRMIEIFQLWAGPKSRHPSVNYHLPVQQYILLTVHTGLPPANCLIQVCKRVNHPCFRTVIEHTIVGLLWCLSKLLCGQFCMPQADWGFGIHTT